MPTEIDSLQIKIESQASGAAKGIDELVASLSNLKTAPAVKNLGNSLKKLSTSLESFNMSSSGVKKLADLAEALKPLNGLKMPNLNSLTKLAEITKALDDTTIDAFATSCQKLAVAVTPLATQMQPISSAFANMPRNVTKTVSAMNSYTKSATTAVPATEKLSKALTSVKLKFGLIVLVARKVFSTVGGWVNNINSYVENVNLFTVSMGEYAGEAMEYAEAVHDAMGIDVSEFIRNQGIFMSMATGFGLATDKAYEMSKGLTELSYDLASFFNISLDAVGDGAFSKVQSGIAGELEPLRRLGFALSEASLQQVAYSKGIQMSVRDMTEAQKSTLRYVTMIEQAANMGVIGDMSRTLMTPANAIRILKQQLNELSRELGSLFIPIIIKVIPYVQAFVRVLTDVAHALAAIIGFTLPTIDYSGLSNAASNASSVTEGLDDATESAKALKSQMMGIDELNVVNQGEDTSTASTGNGLPSDLGLDISSIWDESIFKNIENQVDELMPKMKEFATVIGVAAVAWGSFKVGSWIVSLAGIIGGSAFLGDFKAFVSLLKEGWGLLPTLSAAFPGFANALAAIGGGSVGAGLAVVGAVLAAIGSAIYYVTQNTETVTGTIKRFFDQQIEPKLDGIRESFKKMGDVLQPIINIITKVATAIGNFITETLGIKSIGDVFEGIGAVIFHTVGSVIAGAFAALTNIIKGAIGIIQGLVSIVGGVVKAIVSLFTLDFKAAGEAVWNTIGGIIDCFVGLWDMTVGAVIAFVDGVCGWFKALWDELVGHSIVPDTINAIVEWFASLPKKILGGLKKFCDDVAQKFKDMWSHMVSWYEKNVAPKFTREYWINKLDGLRAGIVTSLNTVKSIISEKWNSITDWFTSTIKPKFTKEYWSNVFVGLKDGFIDAIKKALNLGIDMLNKFIGWLNSKLDFGWDAVKIAGKTVVPAGNITLFTIPKITQKFADGGFIEDGLFTMNRGEIAGKFNNGKSVVANNEQIIEGISAGVYNAVVAAMGSGNRESGNGQSINVYLDGKQIYSSIKKTESERGKQLFGNQLNYGF